VKKYIVATVLMVMTGGVASAQDGDVKLTLKEAVKMAVEKNLDVRVELYNPATAEADIRKYLGIYNPLLNVNVNYQDSAAQPSNAFTSGGAQVVRLRSTNFDAGVSKYLFTGGTAGIEFNNSWNHDNFGGLSHDYFQSNAGVNVRQPLLKNFGRETTELNINVARLSKEGSLEQFRSRLLDIISQVNTQYYQLYSVRQNLEAKRTSLNLAQTILDNTKAQVNAGVLPAMENLNAQFGLSTQQKNLIDAERAYKDQIDQLKLLLQIRDTGDIIPVDSPFQEQYSVDVNQEVQNALNTRPDLKQLRVSLKSNELQSRVARNQTLPQLDFTASASFSGLDSTYNRDLERVGSGKYPAYAAGLQLTYPLGNDAARNDYIKSKLKVEQSKTLVLSLEESVTRDIRIASRAVVSGYQQLDVTARGRAYADEVLQAYIKKQKVGLATTKDVLDVMNNQVAAKSSEIQALTDYNNAIVNLWKTTGELLEREGIRLGGNEADALYKNNR
jgi:outer membrane protein